MSSTRPRAFVAYAGATRLAQRMILNGYETDRYERELNRYSLAYGIGTPVLSTI